MTLQKAIEILIREMHDITLSPDPDVPTALKIGIEAIERVLDLRGYSTLIGIASSNPGRPLPSEVALEHKNSPG